MKKILGLMALCSSILALPQAQAHGAPTPNHGGMVQAVGETWLELVVHGDAVEVYVQDDGDDMPTADMMGKIAIVKGGARSEVALKPAGGNKFATTAPGIGKGARVLTVLTLADKKTKVSAAFDIK